MSTDKKVESSQVSEQVLEHRRFRDDEFWKELPGWSNVSHDEFADHKWQNKNAIRKVEQVEKVLGSRVSKETMDDIYAGQDNILSLIKRYRNDLSTAETILQKAKNKMRFTSFALNKKIKDDPEILAMVDNALDKCAKLDKSKKSENKDSHHNHKHSKKHEKK